MKQISVLSLIVIFVFSTACGPKNTEQVSEKVETGSVPIGTIEVVAEMDISPGNVAVSEEGRVFTSIHPLRSQNIQLVEIAGKTTYQPFPNQETQGLFSEKTDDQLDAPLGVIFDKQNRLWVIDAGLNIGKTRLFAYDIDTRKELYRFDIPKELAPENSFVQDLAIDETNGFVYLADFGNPGIIVVNINTGTFRKITHTPSMAPEDRDMIIDGEVVYFGGSPARIGINPITLSDDRETLYYGAMTGTKWYQLPASLIREGARDEKIFGQLSVVGNKPISDGVATDDEGNHYFTNVENYSIDVLSKDGALSTLKKDPLFDWTDNVRIHKDWLYIAVNQLHKAPAFTGEEEKSTPPYYILRLKF